MDKIEITIIGAGVIGLAVAEELSKYYHDVFIVERNISFGRETSSRNSEVIHAGLYYPKNSIKHKTCMEGARMLYDFCAENNVAFKKTGKLIVTTEDKETQELTDLFRRGVENGVTDLKLLSREEVKRLEAAVEARAAIHSPSTGILDSHGFMKRLTDIFQGRGGRIAYDTEVTRIEMRKGGYVVEVNNQGSALRFFTRILINCAGLMSDKVSAMAGLEKEEYKLKYCKGDYFRVRSGKAWPVSMLVYPVPVAGGAGLGVHATLDLAGSLRLGPDHEYVEKIDYNIRPGKARYFYEKIRRFLPFIRLEEIGPDTSGMRPKLQGPADGFRDFIIKDEAPDGLEGFINLIGIESPGLTASLSIAVMVKELVKRALQR